MEFEATITTEEELAKYRVIQHILSLSLSSYHTDNGDLTAEFISEHYSVDLSDAEDAIAYLVTTGTIAMA